MHVLSLGLCSMKSHVNFKIAFFPGVDNWSKVHTKLVAICPDFNKDSEACQKKWSSIYNDYKEDKATNLKSGSNRSEKSRWYGLVDEFMFDRANVVSHAHANAFIPEGIKSFATFSDSPQDSKIDNKCNDKSPQITSSSKSGGKKKKEGMVLKILSLLSIF
jgi:hypothetical protein